MFKHIKQSILSTLFLVFIILITNIQFIQSTSYEDQVFLDYQESIVLDSNAYIDSRTDVIWSFSIDSLFYGLTVLAMSKAIYDLWNGVSLGGTILSDGTLDLDSGVFNPSSLDIWYIVFLNNDVSSLGDTIRVDYSVNFNIPHGLILSNFLNYLVPFATGAIFLALTIAFFIISKKSITVSH